MSEERKAKIRSLLGAIATGDPAAVAVVDESRYIQHNPQTHEGSEGLAALFARLAKTNPRVNLVRVFADGDFVFAHTEYDFATRRIGFEVFRFDGEYAVEHWDNIQPRLGPNASGRSMVDGPTAATDLERTEAMRARVHSFVEDVLIPADFAAVAAYVEANLVQHHWDSVDGRDAFVARLRNGARYTKLHRVLAEGSFVLAVSEGFDGDRHVAFYDLFRLNGQRIAEHWCTIEEVPPASEWKNHNGKF